MELISFSFSLSLSLSPSLSLSLSLDPQPTHSPTHLNSPFRNCKLTRILENALSGNSRTLLIATLSPKVSNRTESRNTLCFAQRASKLETRITVQKKVTKETLQRELKKQATVLKERQKELAEKVRWIQAMDELVYTLKAMGVEDDFDDLAVAEHK